MKVQSTMENPMKNPMENSKIKKTRSSNIKRIIDKAAEGKNSSSKTKKHSSKGSSQTGDIEEIEFIDLMNGKKPAEKERLKKNKKRHPAGKKSKITPVEIFVLSLAMALVVMCVFIFGNVLELRARTKSLNSFTAVGANFKTVNIIGESGLLAIEEAAKNMASGESTGSEEGDIVKETTEPSEKADVRIDVRTMRSDIRINFVNNETGRVIQNVPFRARLTYPDGTREILTNTDLDGIIYRDGMKNGTHTVTLLAFEDKNAYPEYKILNMTKSVDITDKLSYKEVDVSSEVLDESQVNKAAEEKATKDVAVESAPVDTVEFVESSSQDRYEKIDKSILSASVKKIPGTTIGDFVYLSARRTETELTIEAKQSLTLKINESGNLDARANISGAEISYTSENDGIAKVSSDGTVTAVAKGETNIVIKAGVTVDGNSKTAEVKARITVEEAENNATTAASENSGNGTGASSTDASSENKSSTGASSSSAASSYATSSSAGNSSSIAKGIKIYVPSANFSLNVGESKVGIRVTNGKQGEPLTSGFTYKSENASIAVVDSSGKITGVGPGKVLIYAEADNDPNNRDGVTVTVVGKASGDPLKTNNGAQVYVIENGKYREATKADKDKFNEFYIKSGTTYYGWQTLGGVTYYYDKNGNKVTGTQTIRGVRYEFNGDGALQSTNNNLGIDVSAYQGAIDWNAVKNAGVKFAIIRVGFRGYGSGSLVEDSRFRSNIQGALNAGIRVGVYIFSSAVNEVEAVEEASMCLNLVRGYNVSLPIYIDMESSGSGSGRADRLPNATRTAIAKAFCSTVTNSGYRAGVYANKTWFTNYLDTPSLTGYSIWLAQYSSRVTYNRTKYDIWQYSSNGSIPGIRGRVDVNIGYNY